MVFLIRKMRSDPELRRFKVVVVTDRRDLQKQLSDTAEPDRRGADRRQARDSGAPGPCPPPRCCRRRCGGTGKDLVFAMIQKYRGELIDADATDDRRRRLTRTTRTATGRAPAATAAPAGS